MNLQLKYDVKIGEDINELLTFDLIDSLQEWCELENEQQCKYFIQTNLNSIEVSIGEFNKGILKISTIARELSKVCEKMEKVDLLYKLSKVDEYILKFVATNQSIYAHIYLLIYMIYVIFSYNRNCCYRNIILFLLYWSNGTQSV